MLPVRALPPKSFVRNRPLNPMRKQSELLDQLKIDRSEPAKAGISPLVAVIIGVAALAVGIIGGTLLGRGEPPADDSRSAAVPDVAVSPPDAEKTPAPNSVRPPAGDDDRILNASGYITARQIATVSSQITGLITEVSVEEGMVVEQGQVLARLDDELVRVDLDLANARLASQRAVVDSVQANLSEATRVFERAQRLRPQGLVSEAELTEANARFDSLTADFKRAQADLGVFRLEVRRQEERLEDHIITAPFAGVVTVKNAQTGEIVSPGSAGGGFTRTGICTIVDMASLEIEVDVNESFIGRVFSTQRVVATLDAYPDWDIPGSVIAIIPTADRAKATVTVRIGIDARDPRILPDMGVKVAFLKE
jgi:RND family efflux transporter MFP subunit